MARAATWQQKLAAEAGSRSWQQIILIIVGNCRLFAKVNNPKGGACSLNQYFEFKKCLLSL
jgi:hypothetical protein